jgi:carboxymethylenebutenolidase
MSLRTEWLTYGPEGEYKGYLALPALAVTPLPGVLVVQEAGGVDGHIEDVTRRIASAGYAAFAPDLFARKGERPPALKPDRLREVLEFFNALAPAARSDPKSRDAALDAMPPDMAARIRETIMTMFAGGFFPALAAASTYLRKEQPVTRGQRIASMGFCMGGGLSALLAAKDSELAGAVMFYGRPPPEEDIPNIACPVIAFYGREDTPLIASLPAFQEAMNKHGKRFEAVIYDGAEHAFFNDSRPSYDVRAARDSFARTLEFLRRILA